MDLRQNLRSLFRGCIPFLPRCQITFLRWILVEDRLLALAVSSPKFLFPRVQLTFLRWILPESCLRAFIVSPWVSAIFLRRACDSSSSFQFSPRFSPFFPSGTSSRAHRYALFKLRAGSLLILACARFLHAAEGQIQVVVRYFSVNLLEPDTCV